MLRSPQRLFRWFLVLMVAASAALVGTATSAGATDPEPDIHPGNPSCASLGYANEIKFENVGLSGQDGAVSYTATVVDGVFTVDWTSDTPVDVVITKQANGAAVFVFEPPATSGTAHVATGNDQGDISHLTFCLAGPVICPDTGEPMTEDVDGDGDIDVDDCDFEEPFTCPGETEPMTDVNGDGDIDVDDCDFEEPFTCPGETEPMTDVNGDGDIDADDCDFVAVIPETQVPSVPVIPVEVAAPVTPVTPITPVEPATPTEPVAPEPAPVVDVLEETVTPAIPDVAPTVETPAVAPLAVLGAQVERASLPRTGNDGTTVLALTGLALVLLGAGLRRMGKQAMPLA